MGMEEAPDKPPFWLPDALAEELELFAFAEADALAEVDAEVAAEVVAAADALEEAETLAEADTLADALWLSAGALALELHAARPKVAARLRDRTAIDFFTVFSFLVDPRAMPGRPIVWLFVE